jgi:hypothetical protein
VTRKHKLLEQRAVYEADDSDMLCALPPFKRFVFLVLNSWEDRDGGLRARVLILVSDDERIFPERSVHHIDPAYWLWMTAVRIA